MTTPSDLQTFPGEPTKRFFVDMLTRDIDLKDAILDLLDNCVDGAQRTNKSKKIEEAKDNNKPYDGYFANITLNADMFMIEDNCGGIPFKVAEEYAFRMGRPNEKDLKNDINKNIDIIGTYGIGMKRSIFKMGRFAEVKTQTSDVSYSVNIDNEWLSGDSWDMKYKILDEREWEYNGTRVYVTNLYNNVAFEFNSEHFIQDLVVSIRSMHSFIISKGFNVKVNGVNIQPAKFDFLFSDTGNEDVLAPYMYKGVINDVDVNIVIGFHKTLTSPEEIEEELVNAKNNKEEAGWTVICNDRVIVYKDKSRLTGWGEAGVPQYHSQFRSISGYVLMKGDPRKLPLTTTKRGLEGGSDTFLQAKNYMREGMRIFINFTNQWKGELYQEGKRIADESNLLSAEEIARKVSEDKWKPLRDESGAKSQVKYMPVLPKPEKKKEEDYVWIRFRKPRKQVRFVGDNIIEDDNKDPSAVGEAAFEYVYRELNR